MSLQGQANPSFIRLRYLLTEPIPEQLLRSELTAYNQMLWKDAWYPDHTGGIMNKLWVNAKNKAPYQDIALQLDIGDQLAIFIMLTAYYHDMKAGEEIPQITTNKFPIEVVANFFTYYLHEKLDKIKSIKIMLSLALDKNHPLNSFILVYINSDKVPDLLSFLWKKYVSLEPLKYKPYLSSEEEARCIILYYKQHIEWLTVIILYLHRFPEKAQDNLLKEILIFSLKNRFLHPTCIQLQNYPNSAFTVKSVLYFSILLTLKVTSILAENSALNEKFCKELFVLIPPNDVTAAPFIMSFTMMLNGVLVIGASNVWNLGAQSILGGALVALDDLLKFKLFQRCQFLRNIAGGIIAKVIFKLLDNFEIEPIDQTETIFSLACNSFSSSDPIVNSTNLSIAKETILNYCLNSFPLIFKPTMAFLCALAPTLTARQAYSMLGSLQFFNTPLSGDISLSEDRERCLTETTEILKSRTCALYIPGRTFGEIVEWGGQAAIKWKFVFSAWNLFLGRLELFVDESNITIGDLEKASLILKLVHCLLDQDRSLFDELNGFCCIASAVFSRAVEIQFEEKGDILFHSIKLVNLLGEIDCDFFSTEMTNASAFSNAIYLTDAIVNNPSSFTRENSKLFDVILALLDLYDVVLSKRDIPTQIPDTFVLSYKQLLQHILKNNLSFNDNEVMLKMHKKVILVITNIQGNLEDWEKSEIEISGLVHKSFNSFLLKETAIMELMFFQFDMLNRLTESQQSDFLRDACVSLLVSILKLLETLLENFGKAYFTLIQAYIVRPEHSFIHVLSEIIMSLNGSELMLASLGVLKELCRHSNFSLMVCLGNTVKSLKSSLTTKLRSSPVLLSSEVRIEILCFIQRVLQFQPSFAEYIFNQEDQNVITILIELLGNYGRDRKHVELIAACFSVLTVVWVTRRECINAESLAKLWKSIIGIMTLFYHKNIEFTETVLELSIGIVTIMMIEFYNTLFIPSIDPAFREVMMAFLDDTYMENYFNLAFTRQKEKSHSYYQKQIRFAVVVRQFVSIFTSKSQKIEFIHSHLNSKRKNLIIEFSLDQLQIMCNNYSVSEVEEIFSELLLSMLSLFRNWHEAIKQFTDTYTIYVSASTWLISQSNVTCLPFQYYLTGSLLLLQSSRTRLPGLNVKSKEKDPLFQPNSLLFTNIVSVFSEILRNNLTVDSSLHELVILNISEMMHQDIQMNIFETAEATPLYFLVIECLKRSLTQNKLALTNLYLLLLTTFSKYDIFAKSQDLSLYFQVVSDLLFCCSTDDPLKKQTYHEIWCSVLDLLSTSLIYGKHNFLNEAKYYLDGVRFINEINSNLANCNSLLVLKENFHLTMFLLHLSSMQNYQINIPFDQLTLTLVQVVEVSIELLLHSEKLTQIIINTENALVSDSKAKEICEEISDVFSDRTALADRGKLWLYKTLRIALTSLHILTPSVEQIISYPSADYMVYCFIYNFQQTQHAYNRLIQPVSALCSCLTVSLELLNKIPAISPNQSRTHEFPKGKSLISSFSWVKNFIEITLSLILSQSCMVLLSGIPPANKQLFKMHLSGEVENFLMALLRVLNRKNIQSTPNKRRSRITCSLSMQSTGDSMSVKSSSLGFGDQPDQIFFMTIDNLRKQIF